MASDISNIVAQLKQAVIMLMNPTTSNADRLAAFKICEEFKSQPQHSMECSLLLIGDSDISVSHFGLQLLEYSIKSQWTHLSAEQRTYVKSVALKMMYEAGEDSRTAQPYIKDGIARIFTEVVKREWPQQWPDLIPTLSDICSRSALQMELVLRVLQRLAEDAVDLQTIANANRRREITQALSNSMPEILQYFLSVLQADIQKCQQACQASDRDSANALVVMETSYRNIASVLNMFNAYLDWLPVAVIFQQNGLLLNILCSLLTDNRLRLISAECLFTLVNRKNKYDEGKALLVLFNEPYLSSIVNAVQQTSLSAADLVQGYTFLKKISMVLVGLGSLLAQLLTAGKEDVAIPATFHNYMVVVLHFTSHPGQVIATEMQVLWSTLLKCELIAAHSGFQQELATMIRSIPSFMMQIERLFNSRLENDNFLKLDFEDEEDFRKYYSRSKSQLGFTMRSAVPVLPRLFFDVTHAWVSNLLSTALSLPEGAQNSTTAREWEIGALLLEAFMSALTAAQLEEYSEPLNAMLRTFFSLQPKDPFIFSSQLSCISSLFRHLTVPVDIVRALVDRISAAAVFAESSNDKDNISVHRHGIGLLLKICRDVPHVLLPCLPEVFLRLRTLSELPSLRVLERVSMVEALLMVVTSLDDAGKVSTFVREIVAPVTALLSSESVKSALWDSEKFIAYVGLNSLPTSSAAGASDDPAHMNRINVTYCINMLAVVAKRTAYCKALSASSASAESSAVMTALCEPLPHVFSLIRVLNELEKPVFMAKMHPSYKNCFAISDADRNLFLGIERTDPVEFGDRPPHYKMHLFCTALYENSHSIVGSFMQCFGQPAYELPNLAAMLTRFVLEDWHAVAYHRLRTALRLCIKPYFQYCPVQKFTTALQPVLEFLCPVMHTVLVKAWEGISQSQVMKSEHAENDEVVEEQLVRCLAREYMDTLDSALFDKPQPPRRNNQHQQPQTEAMDDDMAAGADDEDGEMEGKQQHAAPPLKDVALSDVGQLICSTESVYPSVLLAYFTSLTWHDSPTCNRSAMRAWPILHQVTSKGSLAEGDAAHCFTLVLKGLQVNGEDTAPQHGLISLALRIYEHLVFRMPLLRQVILQVPNINSRELQMFEEKLQLPPASQLGEKKKREIFRALIQGVIAQNVGQLFSNPAHIDDLPPILRPRRPSRHTVTDTSAPLHLASLFGPDEHHRSNGGYATSVN